MKFQVKCSECGETFWVRGHVEPDVNATVIEDFHEDCCAHLRNGADFSILDSVEMDFE